MAIIEGAGADGGGKKYLLLAPGALVKAMVSQAVEVAGAGNGAAGGTVGFEVAT